MAYINLHNVSKEEEILYKAYKNLIYFGKVFLPGDFMRSKTPQFHYEIARELLSDSNKPLAIIISRGHGKHLRLDQLVLTDSGWKKVVDLTINDMVYGSDGKLKHIIAFSDTIYKDKTYKITLRDGRSLVVSGEHLWTVRRISGGSGYKTLTTEELLNLKWRYSRKDSRYNTEYWNYNFAIDNPTPIEFSKKELPIEPYVLGLAIGDGSINKETGFTRIHSCVSDYGEIIDNIPYDIGKIVINKNAVRFSILGIGKKIKSLGLNVNVYNKFIPDVYLNSCIEDRIELLRGLMDTDGTLATKKSRGKKAYFTTVSNRLADNVVYLVRSLGGTAIKTFHKNKYSGYYNIAISIAMNPFKLKRKADRFIPHDKLFNAIVDIRELDGAFVRCITVDSYDDLFIANDFILTHNSTLVKGKIIHDLVFAKKAKEWGFTDKKRNYFIGWVSSSQKKSRNNVKYVKLHLAKNDKLLYYFGKDGVLAGDVWNQEDIVTVYGDRLISSSNLTSMRGDTEPSISGGALRYSYVIADDAENEENTRTAASRSKIVDNIMDGILPAIEKNEPGSRLFFIATPVHYDSMAQHILDNWEKAVKAGIQDEFSWRVITYAATQPDMPGGVLWDSWMPRSVLDRIKREYAESPKGIGGYYQEYELQVQSSETSLWTINHLKFWDGYHIRDDDGQSFLIIDGVRIPVNIFIGVDPATDIDTKFSDYSVIMAIAMDMNKNLYVLEYERHRGIPTLALRGNDGEIIGKKGVVDYIFDFYNKYHFTSGTVEDVAMNRSIFQSLNAEKMKTGMYDMSIIPEKPGGMNKHNRIYTFLNSYFSNGQIYIKDGMHDLINEIVRFGPQMAHDDVVDSLYYAARHAYPPTLKVETTDGKIKYIKPKRKPRPWIVA